CKAYQCSENDKVFQSVYFWLKFKKKNQTVKIHGSDKTPPHQPNPITIKNTTSNYLLFFLILQPESFGGTMNR
ncbi:MAG: hypothetical protein ACHQIM_11240, partial [Sphingobacteriales bacterium]